MRSSFVQYVNLIITSQAYRRNYLLTRSSMLQGVDLYERDANPYASSEGFYPVRVTCLNRP